MSRRLARSGWFVRQLGLRLPRHGLQYRRGDAAIVRECRQPLRRGSRCNNNVKGCACQLNVQTYASSSSPTCRHSSGLMDGSTRRMASRKISAEGFAILASSLSTMGPTNDDSSRSRMAMSVRQQFDKAGRGMQGRGTHACGSLHCSQQRCGCLVPSGASLPCISFATFVSQEILTDGQRVVEGLVSFA